MLKPMRFPKASIWFGGALAAGVMFAWGGTALAQATVGELVVTARYHGKELRSLSAPVSYRDLDLTTKSGRDTLRRRVKATAADSCRRLGEANTGVTSAAPSCEQDAINSAQEQMRVAFAQAVPRPKP